LLQGSSCALISPRGLGECVSALSKLRKLSTLQSDTSHSLGQRPQKHRCLPDRYWFTSTMHLWQSGYGQALGEQLIPVSATCLFIIHLPITCFNCKT